MTISIDRIRWSSRHGALNIVCRREASPLISPCKELLKSVVISTNLGTFHPNIDHLASDEGSDNMWFAVTFSCVSLFKSTCMANL